ncbi:MAG: hypothetical protein AAF404_18805, partial [Pseudomonadota bacterium]
MSAKLSVAGMVLMTSMAAHSRAYSPRVVSEHNVDAYSMQTFVGDARFQSLSGNQKAGAMFNYLADYDTGIYSMGSGAFEGADTLYEYSLVRDPVKIINVYGYGYCDVFGPVMAGVWADAGLGAARVVDLPLIDHVATELFYEGAWHYIDLDLRATFQHNNASLASLQEARTLDSLWNRPNSPLFFPQDDLAETQRSFSQSDVINRYGVHQSGHTMDYVLRQGESFTRWWQPQGGRWLHHPNFVRESFVNDIIESEPSGPKSKHTEFTRHTHGNGQFVYQPDLTSASTDFIDGVYDFSNVETSTGGLTLSTPGSGYAIFEVRTPYVIVPLVGSTATTADDRDASVVNVSATGASYSVSTDNGLTWQPLAGSRTMDLTRLVAGTYGYLFRIELNGNPGQAVLDTFSQSTWVQVAPAALPSLRAGSNRMEYRTGDHFGLPTRVVEVRPDTADQSDFFNHLVLEPQDYQPQSTTERIRSPFVMVAQAPPATKIAWFNAGGSFASYQLANAAFTEYSMAYAVDLPFSYTDIYSASMPQDMQHWHSNAHREIRLTEPADAIYLRYQGVPAVNTAQVYMHVLDDDQRSNSTVNITHQWLEDNTLRSYRTTSDNGVYYVDTGADPVNVSVVLSVGSDSLEALDDTSSGDTENIVVGTGALSNKDTGLW